jgi:uncharacterized repeat protein (TIGR01451 family)
MKRSVQRLGLMLLAAGMLALPGCIGVSQNPSYFPWLCSTGDIVPTHAKPPGPGYYANFDPHAVRLEVRPLDATNPVRTQHVLIATVYDEKGLPRRNRRVEWMIEGVGNLIEVDESGFWPGRGYKTNNKHGVSYTSYFEHRLSRGTDGANDDLVIRPGQTWCIISSAVEGDTHVTAYAPGVANWEKGKAYTTLRWVDAFGEFPPPAQVRAGTDHVLTTRIRRFTDKQPLANYRVRYRIVDGPPAVFVPTRTQEVVVSSDLSGNAQVAIAQVAPVLGTNRVAIEIIRPPDPTAPSGSGLTLARGETTVEWLAPAVALAVTGPPQAVLDQEFTVTSTISNTGRLESRAMTLVSQVPEGVEFVRSQPPGFRDGQQVTWTFGLLQAGQAHSVQATYRARRPGPVTTCSSVTTEEGLKDEKCVITNVGAPSLKVAITGPATGMVGTPLTFQVTVSNTGSGSTENVTLTADFDPNLEHETRANPLQLPLGPLAANDSRNIPLILTPRQVGQMAIRVNATAAGGLSDQAQTTVQVQQPQVSLTIAGPRTRYKDRQADFDLEVSNPGDLPLANVVLRDRLPPELAFLSATEGGQIAGPEVVWNLGTLPPREKRVVRLSTRAQSLSTAAVQVAVVTSNGLRREAQAALEILGAPGTRLEARPMNNPVEIGKNVSYVINVSNTGSAAAKQVEIRAMLPAELKVLAGKGPSGHNIAGQVLTFGPVDCEPNQTLEYTIECQALRPGDVRVRMELRTPTHPDTATEPIFQEVSTRLYDPTRPAADTAPPPPPPPPLPPGL